jgi:hypothetical protein
VTIQRRVNEDIPGRGDDAADVPRLFQMAREDDRRIGAEMAMPRQAEACAEALHTRRYLPKREPVYQVGLLDFRRKAQQQRKKCLVRPAQVKPVQDNACGGFFY